MTKTEDELRVDATRQTNRRDKMASEGLRALLFLNGGGAVALLAFLQAIWNTKEARGLIVWIPAGMIPLIVVAALSGWVHFTRYETTIAYQMKGGDRDWMTAKHNFYTASAFWAFILGMAIVIFGAFQNLPR